MKTTVRNFVMMCIIASLLIIPPSAVSVAAPSDDWENYTYTLTQSTAAYKFWTTTPSERVFKDSAAPAATGSGIKVYAARNEFEPFQIVVKPTASGNVTVNMGSFGSGITVELYQVKYVYLDEATDSLGRTGPYPDPLWPLANGASVALTAGENTAFWFNVFVPASVTSGNYTANMTIGSVAIPVTLHVFNFAIPDALHIESQMNYSHQTFLSAYSVPGTDDEYWAYVDGIKQYFIDHRLTPSSVLWPGGLTGGGSFAEPFIDYDCHTHTLSDPWGVWGYDLLAERYLDGSGLLGGQFTQPFNGGTGFPSFTAAGFDNNDPSTDQRPSSFCGITRSASDWLQNPTSAYNTAWFAYVTALQNYLSSHGDLGKAYHYFANEPQDQADYDAVAWYSRYSHQAAPNLKLMVSEGAKPEIYDQPGAHIDIWLPVLNEYDPTAAHARERDHGEQTWIYFLHGTRPPYFNPITLDHPAIEGKFTGWFLWKYRVRGIAYYAVNDWSKNPWTDPMTYGQNGNTFLLYPPSESNTPIPYGSNGHRLVPSIRLEMLRDGFEDYEYLYVLAGGQPQVDVTNPADTQANKIITGLTSYTRHSEFMYNLRRLIGLKNGGEIATIPDITPPPTHPRAEGPPGNYYINFQDPAGQPTANPLIVNGHTYMKIGGQNYNATAGYGWYAPNDVHWMTTYLSSGPNVLQRSILYSDWGRPATFEFDLPNGDYNVTVSVGWEGQTYSHNYIAIEGIVFVNNEATSPYIVRTKRVTITDNKLTMAMGIFDEYTMLNYLDIEAAGPTAAFTADVTSGDAPLTVHFTDASTNGPTAWAWDFENDGTTDSTEQHPTHTYTAPGVYTVRLRVTNDGGSDDDIKPDYITVRLPAVHDLRITDVQTETGALTAQLRWTPLPQAVTTTLRYAPTFITDGTWAAATVIGESLPGSTDSFTAHVQYAGGSIYFTLKSQDASGAWLGLSNNAYWPSFEVYLPLVMRN
ncbi:MAG: glycoside hydrolase domain-containing protein [Anaerolineae bacterium]